MRKILLGSFMTLGVMVAMAQATRAKVQHLSGKEIYLLSEPDTEYETVASVKTGPKLTSILTRGIYNEHVNDKTTQFVNKTLRKLNKKSIEFDALVYNDGKTINAVKFGDTSNGMATVQKINGIAVFAMAEPVQEYEVRKQVSSGINIVPFLTAGWINNSIEKDVSKYIKKANKADEVDAILYQSGRKASLIALE